MDIIIPSQTVQIPDPTPFDPSPLDAKIAALEARVLKLETPPVPVPTPTSWFWSKKLLDNAPLNPNSPALVADLVRQSKMSAPNVNVKSWTMPTYVVNGNTLHKTKVTIIDAGNAQPLVKAEFAKGIPLPTDAKPGFNNPDGKIQVIDLDTDRLYEMQRAKVLNGIWSANSGAIHDKWSKSDGQMPAFGTDKWNTGTATWLPMVAGLATLEEMTAGVIPHALSMCIVEPLNRFVWPAKASDGSPGKLIPEGTRFRLPVGFVLAANIPPLVKMLLEAIIDYGIFVVDRGGSLNIYCEDPKGNDSSWLPYTNGKKGYEMGAMIPWDRMAVVA